MGGLLFEYQRNQRSRNYSVQTVASLSHTLPLFHPFFPPPSLFPSRQRIVPPSPIQNNLGGGFFCSGVLVLSLGHLEDSDDPAVEGGVGVGRIRLLLH